MQNEHETGLAGPGGDSGMRNMREVAEKLLFVDELEDTLDQVRSNGEPRRRIQALERRLSEERESIQEMESRGDLRYDEIARAGGRSAEREVLESFTDDEVKQALADLPESFRVAVYLADVEGFAYKEIAEILEIPIGTVMSRLHRGRKALQKSLYEFAVARGLTDEVPAEPAHQGSRPR